MSRSVEEMLRDQWLPTPSMRRALRESAGLTLMQVADLVGVSSKMTISRWERGAQTPRGTDRVAYSRLLRKLTEAIDRA